MHNYTSLRHIISEAGKIKTINVIIIHTKSTFHNSATWVSSRTDTVLDYKFQDE